MKWQGYRVHASPRLDQQISNGQPRVLCVQTHYLRELTAAHSYKHRR